MENVNVCDCNIIHKEVVKNALENKPAKEELERLSQVFKLLGDLTRTEILWVLDKNEMCVCDIANVLRMTKSSISHQLNILKMNNIVKCRKSGKEVYYTLDDEHVQEVFEVALSHVIHKERL